MLLHADSFSMYGPTAALLLNGIYANNRGASLPVDPDGISPNRVLRTQTSTNNTYNDGLRLVLPVSNTVGGVATRVWLTSLPTSNNIYPWLFSFCDQNNVRLISVGVNTAGRLRIRNLISGVTTDSDKIALTPQGWFHVEAKMTVGGTLEVRVEGQVIYNAAENTGAALIGQIRFGEYQNDFSTSGQPNVFYKDFVVWNGAGARNNDFLGSVLVAPLVPSADVSLNWTPVGGASGAAILDNVPPDDAAYIAADDNPLPAAYVADMTNLPEEATSVRGIVTFVRAAKSDGGDGSMQVGLISAGSTALGENRPITVAQTYWRDVFEVDPATGAQWLPTAVNLAQLRINRTL